MAPKRSGVKTRLLALACCCQQSVLLFGKTGYITNSSRRFQWNTVTDFRARLTGSQHPAGSQRFFIVLVLKFIWHKAQKLLDQKFLRGSEGLSSAQLWRESINQSPHNGSAEMQLWNVEPDRRNWGQSLWKKKHHPTILHISHNVWLDC